MYVMKKFLNGLLSILLYIWQLPQNIAGLILLLYFRKERKVWDYEGIRFYVAPKMQGAITLGQYIILSPYSATDTETFIHEFGHTIQSKYLGPLYLIVIGITSLLHAALHDCKESGKSYYHFYTERWANNLALKYLKRHNIEISYRTLCKLYEISSYA